VTTWKRATTPEEKHEFLAGLETQWNVPQDMRFGQLIINAIGYHLRQNNLPTKWQDIDNAVFYTEDTDLLQIIKNYINGQYPPMASTAS
jgi:hypothetical protein